jgi:methyltransferase (TIGR00027 family)
MKYRTAHRSAPMSEENSDMLPEQASQTMVHAAIRRAAHQLLDRPRIFDDPIAVGLIPEASEQSIMNATDDHRAPISCLLRSIFACRSRFAEERLSQATARGVCQYVIVGAGLDTFPWRQPAHAKSLRIFWVDHPVSLAWARERIRERGLATPLNLTFVTADLEKHELAQRLAEHGFSEQVCTFCSVLGVTYYLSWEAIEALFRFAASLPSQSEIVFSFTPPDELLAGHDLTVALYGSGFAASVGEPWKTRITVSEISNLLENLGYGEVFHLTPLLAQKRYFAGRTDSLRAPHVEQLIAAIV